MKDARSPCGWFSAGDLGFRDGEGCLHLTGRVNRIINSRALKIRPELIEAADKAKLSTERLRVQYESLLVRPVLCLAMVLLAATVSLRSFRSGGIQTMVTTGMVGGVGFFLFSEIARQIGIAGLAPAWVAAWVPVVLVLIISTTVLLHQEDG